ncbi:MAG: response regulator [Candidatus Thermoplasmatota archaeon]
MKKSVMIVDDNPDIIYTVKSGLEAMDPDYEVLGASNGEKCLQLLEEDKIPDLILLDIMMPGMTGWETIKQIKKREDWKAIPIVFLTARTDEVAQKAGEFYGEEYIKKPFDIKALKDIIEKNINPE